MVYVIAVAFILGVLVCAFLMYILNLKETIQRQRSHILDLEAQIKELLAEKSNREHVH